MYSGCLITFGFARQWVARYAALTANVNLSDCLGLLRRASRRVAPAISKISSAESGVFLKTLQDFCAPETKKSEQFGRRDNPNGLFRYYLGGGSGKPRCQIVPLSN